MTRSVVGGGRRRSKFPSKAGVAHDLWVGDEDTAPRILQQVDNKDFGIEVKFDSEPTKQYQMHGVIAQETNDHFVRFELHLDGTTPAHLRRVHRRNDRAHPSQSRWSRATRRTCCASCATASSGRCSTRRTATTWTDAAAFSEPLEVTGVGLFGGNARGKDSPAFTAKADFFHNTDLSSCPTCSCRRHPAGASRRRPGDK